MAYTLGELLYGVLSSLGQVTTFRASSGSTTTAVNTLTGITQSNLTGTMIVRRTTDGLAPQGEFSEVSSFAQATGTFTFSPALSAAVGAGDRFAYASPLYPLYQVIESINDGLLLLGDLDLVDTTTLDTAGSQTEYAAAVAWKRRGPTQIDIQGQTGDANDNKWVRTDAWEYIPAAAGSTGLIVFKEQPTSGRDIRVWYVDKHPAVTDYDDVIAEAIPPKLAIAACAYAAAMWQQNRTQGSDPGIEAAYRQAQRVYEEVQQTDPIRRKPQRAKLFSLGRNY